MWGYMVGVGDWCFAVLRLRVRSVGQSLSLLVRQSFQGHRRCVRGRLAGIGLAVCLRAMLRYWCSVVLVIVLYQLPP